jgi:hypothetical protein
MDKVFPATRIFLGFGSLNLENVNVPAISLEKLSDEIGTTVGGVLGIPALGNCRLKIDFHEGTLGIESRRP